MGKVDIDYLRKLFECDFESGVLRTKIARKNSPAGKVVGWIGANGYYSVTIKSSPVSSHRVIWALHYGEWPDGMIDHIDGNPTNNAMANLRLADNSKNQANRRAKSNCSSVLKGVCWNSKCGKWQAQIKKNGESHYLGLFVSEADAHNAYLEKANELFGDFARAA